MLSRSNVGIEFARRAGLWYPLSNSAVAVNGPNDTNENTLATITIPAGALGANGRLRGRINVTVTNNANAKTWRVRLGGIGGTAFVSTTTNSTATGSFLFEIANRNSQSSQWGGPLGGGVGTSSSAFTTASVDTSAQTTLVITCQKGTGTDTMTLENYVVELLYTA